MSKKGGTADVNYRTMPSAQCDEDAAIHGIKVTCTKGRIGGASPARADEIAPSPPRASLLPNLKREILDEHNKYREELDLPPLVWSDTLASHARTWAEHLVAQGGALVHSTGTSEGENLWKGTVDTYTLAQMVGRWGSEKRYFKYRVFPRVSTTGRWQDVGHYTQIIWRETSAIGCALGSGEGYELLVCRYSPQGNVMGEKPY